MAFENKKRGLVVYLKTLKEKICWFTYYLSISNSSPVYIMLCVCLNEVIVVNSVIHLQSIHLAMTESEHLTFKMIL